MNITRYPFGWSKENIGKFKSDEIGPRSEIKLEIIEKYAAAYTKILSNQQRVRLKYESHISQINFAS